MSAWLMGAQLIGQVGSAVMGHLAKKREAKFMESVKAYNNTFVDITKSNNLNAIKVRTIQGRDQATRDAFTIQTHRLEAEAEAEVNAAAAGVQGNSVALTMMQVNRQAANAEHRRQEGLKSHYISMNRAHINTRLSAAGQKNNDYIPKPQAASMLAGIGQSTYKTINQYYPEVDDTIAGWF